jgi:hypothetical protein
LWLDVPDGVKYLSPQRLASQPLHVFPRSKNMTEDKNKTKSASQEFDFSTYPTNTLFHERRNGGDRRSSPPKKGADAKGAEITEIDFPQTLKRDQPRPERRARKERRKRIDPTTFEKQYTNDELEFMNAMQKFKERTGKSFPTHGEVIKVAVSLGYRKPIADDHPSTDDGAVIVPWPLLRPGDPDSGETACLQ